LNGSFLTHAQADILRKQGHDDLAEKTDRVLVEKDLHGLAQFCKVAFVGHQRIQNHQGTGSTADGALWAAGIAGLKQMIV